MNIIVSASAERMGGALTIYKQFLKHLADYRRGNNYYIFVDSSMPRPPMPGVEYITVDTRSSLRRVRFDWGGCKRILDRMGVRADAVVSLQNTCLRGLGDIPQILYFHQSIPLYPQQWNPLKRSERTMAFYKYFYPFFIRYSLPKHVKVVAQIPFIKRGFCRKFGVPEEQVYVCFPDVEQIDIQSVEPYEGWSKDAVHFVYPAIPAPYKHHDTILRALGVIKKREPDLAQRIKVHFTCTPEAAPNIVSLAKEQDADAMVCFEGHVDHSVLLSMYQASHGLLFPSSIETIGLPLLEAAAFGLNVVVSDLDFAREVIAPYEGAQLIDNNNYEAWAEAIAQCARNNRRFTPYEMSGSGSWPSFFDLIN